jgi:threonine dehydratase/serine racemase
MSAPGFADVQAAATRIAPFAHRTPLVRCASLDERAGRRLFFKCEQLQKAGAFKFRGACNAVLRLTEAEAARGVVTHSSGNHAQALALAARLRGIPAYVVMPENAPAVKRRAVEGYGAKVFPCQPTEAARRELARRVQEETGARFVHPFDDPDVIAGQGSVALEALAQLKEQGFGAAHGIIAPVGGGGLLSGLCIAAGGVDPALRVFGAEPGGADDATRSLAEGRRLPQTGPGSIADGLLTGVGEITFPVLQEHVERIFTVDEEEIVAAMRLAWERAKLLIEPSAAVALAAVLTASFRALPHLERLVVVLSGGNVDLDRLPW